MALKGISPHNGCILLALEVSRQDILDYLRCLRQRLCYRPSTNLQDEYMRNKIRLNILPMLRELNPFCQ